MHPDGFHKDEDARERCYGCSHPEMIEMSTADEELAKQLVAEGWQSISNKYRIVARLLTEVAAYEQGVSFSENVPEWFRQGVKSSYNWNRIRSVRMAPDEALEKRELTITEFRAFKKAGGQSA